MVNEFTEQEKEKEGCEICQCKSCNNENCTIKCRANIPCMTPVTKCEISQH